MINPLTYGIITKNEINKLKKVVFSNNAFLVIDLIENKLNNIPLLFILRIVFSVFVSIFTYFIVTIGIKQSLNLNFVFGFYFLTILIWLSVNIALSSRVNYIGRIISIYLDNIISVTISDYRIALAEVIPNFPSPKNIAKDLNLGLNSLTNIVISFSNFISVIIFALMSITAYFVFDEKIYLNFVYLILILLIMHLSFVRFGMRYVSTQSQLNQKEDEMDLEFQDTLPLLTRTNFELDTGNTFTHIKEVVNWTTLINFIKYISVVFVAFPMAYQYFIGNTNNTVLMTFVIVYVCNFTLMDSLFINFLSTSHTSQKRVDEVNDLLDTIIGISSELTPSKYLQIKEEYFASLNSKKAHNSKFDSGGLSFTNLHYYVGRNGDRRKIHVPDDILLRGKISIIVGASGIGKSVFGRIISLRYSEFEASRLELDGKDIRTFNTLDEGISRLHFSGLRNIETSYRRAIRVYLSNKDIDSMLLRNINRFDFKEEDVVNLMNFFSEHKQYYEDVSDLIIQVLKTQPKYKLSHELINNYLLGEIYSLLSSFNDFNKRYLELYSTYDSKVLEANFMAAAVAEYLTYWHLKTYIPEATQFYMDAVLSEPPISQGQRRRVLYALDILLAGDVYVVDEPFANLDVATSSKIFKDLEKYAKEFNAVVVIIDQNLKPNIYGKSDIVDKVLTIESVEESEHKIRIKSLHDKR